MTYIFRKMTELEKKFNLLEHETKERYKKTIEEVGILKKLNVPCLKFPFRALGQRIRDSL